MAWSETWLRAARDILLEWHELTRGDISIILANLQNPGLVMTMAGTPHARFWANLVAMEWAEPAEPIPSAKLSDFRAVVFQLTATGREMLPIFLAEKDLLNMGACSPANGPTQRYFPATPQASPPPVVPQRILPDRSNPVIQPHFAIKLWGFIALGVAVMALGRSVLDLVLLFLRPFL